MVEPFPWAAAMRFGLGTLRLAPAAFWRMTPRELAAAMEAHGVSAERNHPARAWLDAQSALHPDRKETAHDDIR